MTSCFPPPRGQWLRAVAPIQRFAAFDLHPLTPLIVRFTLTVRVGERACLGVVWLASLGGLRGGFEGVGEHLRRFPRRRNFE